MSQTSPAIGQTVRWMAALLAAVLGAGALSACAPLVRERTLPPSIRTVYVPMIVNRTSEPGLEERIVVAVQEEILADGRLRLENRRRADAQVRIFLTEYYDRPLTFDIDGFATNRIYELHGDILLEENIPGRPQIGDFRPVRAEHFYEADPRRTTFDPEPRSKEELYRKFAREVVLELLTGELEQPEEVETDPGFAPLDRAGIRGSELRLF